MGCVRTLSGSRTISCRFAGRTSGFGGVSLVDTRSYNANLHGPCQVDTAELK